MKSKCYQNLIKTMQTKVHSPGPIIVFMLLQTCSAKPGSNATSSSIDLRRDLIPSGKALSFTGDEGAGPGTVFGPGIGFGPLGGESHEKGSIFPSTASWNLPDTNVVRWKHAATPGFPGPNSQTIWIWACPYMPQYDMSLPMGSPPQIRDFQFKVTIGSASSVIGARYSSASDSQQLMTDSEIASECLGLDANAIVNNPNLLTSLVPAARPKVFIVRLTPKADNVDYTASHDLFLFNVSYTNSAAPSSIYQIQTRSHDVTQGNCPNIVQSRRALLVSQCKMPMQSACHTTIGTYCQDATQSDTSALDTASTSCINFANSVATVIRGSGIDWCSPEQIDELQAFHDEALDRAKVMMDRLKILNAFMNAWLTSWQQDLKGIGHCVNKLGWWLVKARFKAFNQGAGALDFLMRPPGSPFIEPIAGGAALLGLGDRIKGGDIEAVVSQFLGFTNPNDPDTNSCRTRRFASVCDAGSNIASLLKDLKIINVGQGVPGSIRSESDPFMTASPPQVVDDIASQALKGAQNNIKTACSAIAALGAVVVLAQTFGECENPASPPAPPDPLTNYIKEVITMAKMCGDYIKATSGTTL